MDVLEIIQTSKKKDCAIFDGHQYRLHRANKQNICSWLCIKETSSNCRGTLKSKDGKVLHVSSHVCVPDVAATEVAKKLCTIKKRVREEDQSVSKIYLQEMSPLLNRGYDYVENIPTLPAVRAQLYRIRRKEQGTAIEPKNSQEIEIMDDDVIMEDGSSFLLADDDSGSRILVLASTKGRGILKTGQNFFMDGTSKSCCMQFYQLYTIHADLSKNEEENTTIVPIIFALLPRKNSEIYSKLFTVLKQAGWNPNSITMDFEVAAIKELERHFPSVNILECNFHFNQCLWSGLVRDYKDDEEIRLHIRMCAALAYLPESYMDDGWLCIQETSPQHAKLQEFFDYFVKEWLENSIITTSMWNCHKQQHKTNNTMEGWHEKFQTILSKPHPKFRNLLQALKDESKYSDF
ncbi:hypothetical protein AVEN_113977-1 [Araneus ventricosus]|uniref:MULE transposase domain-containing protein n=1 Tax=Araneus ventricosus TaxID=182803 RepID=A0A4Y2V9J3_ARAVE|nr:hypothetical protein AVEN_113977-1 [Araneus ventricosus]